jgi:hypothetical protein
VTEPRNPFALSNPEHAAELLRLAWGDFVDEVWVIGDEWHAHRKDAPSGENITASTPDELNLKIRVAWAEWTARG